jgi:hypothetical protein
MTSFALAMGPCARTPESLAGLPPLSSQQGAAEGIGDMADKTKNGSRDLFDLDSRAAGDAQGLRSL